jgi:hypothetical protein
MIRTLIAYFAHRKIQRLAKARLQRLIDERRNSDEVVSYRVRRKAALRHQPKEWAR